MRAPQRLGLIGAGRWGRNYITTIATLDAARLARLASNNPQSAQLIPAGCTISADWRELLDPRQIDGVIIATPPALHADMVRAAVNAGLPVLVEKPLTLNLAEAEALRDFVAARAGYVMVGHTHLFHPAYRLLKQIAPQYGSIHAILAEAGNHGPFREDVPVLWDWGAHDVAMCLDLLGTLPLQASARIVEQRKISGAVGEIVELKLEFSSAVTADIRVGNIMPKRRRFEVRCETATLVYDDLADGKLKLLPCRTSAVERDNAGRPFPVSAELPLERLVRDFADAVFARSRDCASLDLGVNVVRVLDECGRSLRLKPSVHEGATIDNGNI